MWHSQTLKYEATAIHESDNETEVAGNSNIIKRKKYLNLQAQQHNKMTPAHKYRPPTAKKQKTAM
jgi:hypothetical protein